MNNSGLRSDYLDCLAKLLSLEKYIGTLPCDFLAKRSIKSGDMAIVNLSTSVSKGTHYVSIICFDEYLVYLDPFGLKCYDSNILKALEKTNKVVHFLNQSVQSINSLMCGFFCLAFCILAKDSINPIKTIISTFHASNLNKNEDIAIDIIKDSLKKLPVHLTK